MGERLTVDSVMTPDGEVMPLGPVDKEGRKVSLSTATLFADSGMECTVQRYEYLLGAGVWRACCDEGVVRVDEMHLTCPDTFGALMVVEPKMEDVRERSLTKPNVMSVKCPACGMSNSIAWGSKDLPPFRQAVAMLADSWNSR